MTSSDDIHYDLGYLKGAIENLQQDVGEIKANVELLTSTVETLSRSEETKSKLRSTWIDGIRLALAIIVALALLKVGDATAFAKALIKIFIG